jgi:phage gp29-like protein
MTLYDTYGREVDTGMLREEQAAPTMAGVRNIYSVMHPSIGLTPERLTAVLQQADTGDPYLYLELAEEMEEKDLHYLAVLGTRKNAVAQLDLIVRAASSGAEDQRARIWCARWCAMGRCSSTACFSMCSTRWARGFRRPR